MLRISKLTDYGVVVMAYLARHAQQEQACNAKEIAQGTNIKLPTVSKLLKLLARNGLLIAQRGVNGGYSLAAAAQEISLARIISVLEGNIALTECGHRHGLCVMEPQCMIRHNWQTISAAIGETLQEISLAQMIAPITSHHVKHNLKNQLKIGVEIL